jgi:hypothetical protein
MYLQMGAVRRVLIAVTLAALASAGVAAGAELALGDPTSLLPSDPPALLGPITESGRTGWDCAPERAARARDAVTAELPGR